MKQNRTRQGWLIIITLGWLYAGSVLADENSTVTAGVSDTVEVGMTTKPPPESAASQKIFGVNSDSPKIVEPKSVSLMEVMLRMFGALLIVVAILLGVAWWFRKSRMFGLVSAQSSNLKVIETRSLGSKHSLHVVEYGSKCFLIADSPAGINYLTDLEKMNELPKEDQDFEGNFNPGSFAGKLKTLLERKG